MKLALVVLTFLLSTVLQSQEIIWEMRSDLKMDRNSMKSCIERGYERICIDGTTKKEICKIFVNGAVIMASDSRGKLLQIIANSVGLVTSDILCDTYNRPICADILVCKRWEM